MPIAVCRIREQPVYRKQSFVAGLERAGLKVVPEGRPSSNQDFLVIWSRYGAWAQQADQWEAEGGTVLVCENGYIGRDAKGHQLYAIAVHGHNGSGWFPVGTEDRFSALGIDVKPWRTTGDHIIVRGQRGIGPKDMASPPNWHHRAGAELRRITKRPIRLIDHPGSHDGRLNEPVAEYLQNAWCCVIWASAVGVKALTLGIPVMYDAPKWICSLAAIRPGDPEVQLCNDKTRAVALKRMAHAQWTLAEIESGEPFTRMKERIGEARW